jgi:DNA (cytosine-5)-methyltransferase 1
MVIQQSDDGPLRELALFAGIGGGILGGKLLGWRTVCAVERNAYCAAVLAKRQNEGFLEPFPIWSDVETFNGNPWRGIVDIVSGGFPCQDVSCAGKGAGLDGERSGLWSQMSRIIGEVRPRFAWVENSPMLTSRGLDRVLGDLSEMGYDAKWGVVSAADAIWYQGTPCIDHERERIWIVAHNADAEQMQSVERCESELQRGRSDEAEQVGMGSRGNIASSDSDKTQPGRLPVGTESSLTRTGDGSQDSPTSNDARNEQGRQVERSKRERTGTSDQSFNTHTHTHTHNKAIDDDEERFEEQRERIETQEEICSTGRSGWWQSEPDVVRVAHGIPFRVDRLAGLGNAQVPACVVLAWKLLTES